MSSLKVQNPSWTEKQLKVQTINSLRHKHLLNKLLDYFNLARSTYYHRIKVMNGFDKYEEIKEKINTIYKESFETYGYRRMWLKLLKDGFNICQETVRKLMRRLGLKTDVYSKNKSKGYSSYHGTIGKLADNVLKQQFNEKTPLKVFHTDITQIKLSNDNKAYISAIIDQASNEIISLVADNNEKFKLVETMLEETEDKIKNLNDIVIHSDQGFHYQTHAYQRWVDNNEITQSMSRKGNCLDNAPIESFFSLLKCEALNRIKIDSLTSLKKVCKNYVYWFNNERISENKKGLTPIEYRNKSLANA